MNIEELYKNIGGDYAVIKSRLFKDEIIERFLLKFPNEPSYNTLISAIEEKDGEEAFAAAHTLKGVVANLSFDKLYHVLSDLTEQLRSGECQYDCDLLDKVKEYYQEIITEISK